MLIIAHAKIRSEGTKEMEPAADVKMTFKKADISTKTTVLLDIESGLMLSSTAEMEMKMNLGDETMMQKMTGKGKTTITVTPKTEPAAQARKPVVFIAAPEM